MLDFNNTQIAFRSKSNADLKRAKMLYQVMGSPTMVKIGGFFSNLSLKLHLPINTIVKKTIYRQFVGGETIEECIPTIDLLYKFNIGTILDFSREGQDEEKELDFTRDEILKTIEEAKDNPKIPFCVFKPTGMVRFKLIEKVAEHPDDLSQEDKDEYNRFVQRVDTVCEAAYKTGTPILVDAEETWIQEPIDNVLDAMMAKYNKEDFIVFNTVQMYRHDRLAFLEKTYQKALNGNYKLGMKLVRGAYMEKERERAELKGYPSPIYPDKPATDKGYNDAQRYCMANLDTIAVLSGTHNEQSMFELTQLMEEYNTDRDDKRVWFSQLLGMSDHISFNLANKGYNVAKYVPYGPVKDVMPYLMRRAEENTSVAGQVSRELNLLDKEMDRRSLN
jgi:proline dehydrogenase